MTTWRGTCHCGDVRFEVDLEPGTELMRCNCSICSRAGWLLTFVQADAFRLESGEDAVTDYQFGKEHLHHPFCKRCGVRAYSWGNDGEGNAMYGVNARCLEGFDHAGAPVNEYDGKSI